jgi:hypothetical protein
MYRDLNQTAKVDKSYWHIAFASDNGSIKLNLSKVGKMIDLKPYRFKLN